MLNIPVAGLIYLPAAILCFLPVRDRLKHSFVKTAAVMLPALLALILFSVVLIIANIAILPVEYFLFHENMPLR